jgi:hypothetical protein
MNDIETLTEDQREAVRRGTCQASGPKALRIIDAQAVALAESRAECGRLRAKLAAAEAECERLRAHCVANYNAWRSASAECERQRGVLTKLETVLKRPGAWSEWAREGLAVLGGMK